MTSPYLKYWSWGKLHTQYDVSSITETLEKIMVDVLQTRPDVIILAAHHGLYNSKRFPGADNFLRNIIKKYPQIDIVLGGHIHQIYPGEKIYNNTIYVQPGAHAEYISKLEIEINKSDNNTPLIKSELIPVLSEALSDKQLFDIATRTIEKSNMKRKSIIGKTDIPIDDQGIPGINNRISALFAKAIFHTVKTDAVMCGVVKSGYKLYGTITYNDVFNLCPYEDTIVLLSLNYYELKKIVEEQASYKDKYRKKLGLYGKGSDQNGKKLLSLFKRKNKINVAFSSYDIAGAGNRYPTLKKIANNASVRAFDTQILLRDGLAKFIKDKFPFKSIK